MSRRLKNVALTNALDGSEDDILFEEDISNTTTAHEECEDDQEILYADAVDYILLALVKIFFVMCTMKLRHILPVPKHISIFWLVVAKGDLKAQLCSTTILILF